RPRRSRDAARLWAQIAADGGRSAREAVWDHPDLLPGPEDLDDPAGYAARRAAARDEHADVDAAPAAICQAPGGAAGGHRAHADVDAALAAIFEAADDEVGDDGATDDGATDDAAPSATGDAPEGPGEEPDRPDDA